MWKWAAIGLVFLAMATMVAVEFLRRRAYERRVRRGELGGTQDIAMWGTLTALALMLLALACIVVHGCRNGLIVWYEPPRL